jgi:acetyl esterase/lipase
MMQRDRRIFVIPALLLMLLVGACTALEAINQLSPAGHYERQSDIAFGVTSRQRLDVYVPTDAGAVVNVKPPIVVFFYGGGWRRGEKEDYRFVAEYLTRRGVIAVVPNYRLFPEVTFPGFIEDGAAAFAWAKANADRLGGDSARVFLMGHSSGAHTATLLALDPSYLAQHALKPSDIAGVVGISGPYDVDPRRVRWVARIFEGLAEIERALPVEQVRAGAPAMFLANGDRDWIVPPRNAELLADRLRAKGVPAEVKIYQGERHAEILLGLSTSFANDRQLGRDVLAFIRSRG